jgi:hypothetical protein
MNAMRMKELTTETIERLVKNFGYSGESNCRILAEHYKEEWKTDIETYMLSLEHIPSCEGRIYRILQDIQLLDKYSQKHFYVRDIPTGNDLRVISCQKYILETFSFTPPSKLKCEQHPTNKELRLNDLKPYEINQLVYVYANTDNSFEILIPIFDPILRSCLGDNIKNVYEDIRRRKTGGDDSKIRQLFELLIEIDRQQAIYISSFPEINIDITFCLTGIRKAVLRTSDT